MQFFNWLLPTVQCLVQEEDEGSSITTSPTADDLSTTCISRPTIDGVELQLNPVHSQLSFDHGRDIDHRGSTAISIFESTTSFSATKPMQQACPTSWLYHIQSSSL